MKNFFKEFKKFAIKGNAIDLAVGVVIGAAFTAIVNSLVRDVVMPPLGILTGEINFQDKVWVIRDATEQAAAVTINYGQFVNTVIDFLIIAFVIFIVIRQINRWHAQEKPKPQPTEKSCPFCDRNIPKKATRCPECTSKLPIQS